VKIAIDLSAAQAEQLHARAKSLGVHPEELARAAVTDLRNNPEAGFEAAAELVLRENHELYKRLA
jgi:hypothetical protein